MGKRTKALMKITIFLAALLAFSCVSQGQDLDNYKWRVQGNWWFAHPYGYFGLRGSNNYFDINKDFGFGSYSIFTGTVDWKFGHKHHFLLNVSRNPNSRTAVLNRTIEFQGQTYDVGAQVNATVSTFNVAPG